MKAMRKSCIIVACFLCFFALSTQAQETDAPKMLLDSIKKLDVSQVRTALDKGANPNWIYGTGRGTYTVIGQLAMYVAYPKVENTEKKGVEILETLLKAGAKLQPIDYRFFFSPISHGWALFTEVLLKNGFDPTKEIEGSTPMEIAARHGQANIIELLKKHSVPALEERDAAQLALIGAAGDHDIPRMEDAIDNGADVNKSNRQGETALVEAFSVVFYDVEDSATILYLLKKGADPTIQGSEGRFGKTTALHRAMFTSSSVFDKKNQEKNERLKDSAAHAKAVIEALLRQGALVSARDWYGLVWTDPLACCSPME